MSDFLIATPYFSIGLYSPLSTDPNAAIASAVVPPNVAAKSAPRSCNCFVRSMASCSDNPRPVSCVPNRAEYLAESAADNPYSTISLEKSFSC